MAWKRYAAGAVLIAAVYVSATPAGGRWMLECLASAYPPMPISSCPQGDAIAVLAGASPRRERPRAPGEWPNRMETGLALYRAGRAAVLLVPAAEADGPPTPRYRLMSPAPNTKEEVQRIVAVARENHWQRMILVTSGYHMTRARLLMRRAVLHQGAHIVVIPFPADPLTEEVKPPGLNEYRPAQIGIHDSNRALREVLGLAAALW